MEQELQKNMERFSRSFISVMHFFHNMAVEVSRVSDFSLAQFRVLMVIFHYGPMSVNDLKKQLNVAQSSASEILDRLVQQQLILRQKDLNDRRKTMLTLTDRAKRLLQSQQKRVKKFYRTFLENLTEEDQAKLVDAFEQIQNIVEKYHFMEKDA